MFPFTTQPQLHAKAMLAAATATPAAPAVRVREKAAAVPPGTSARGAPTERVQPQRY
jgi:hypothetical protein